jgi:carboxymethylenebutenolidase
LAELFIEYREVPVEDGSKMRVYYTRRATASRRCSVLLFQEAFGVNEHIRDVAQRFAREGYVVAAPELFHRTAPGFEGSYTNMRPAMPHMHALTGQRLEQDIRAAYQLLAGDSAADIEKIGSVGFCMGGRASFLANSILPLAAAVSFYGGGIAPEARGAGLLDRTAKLTGPSLFFWGGRDQHIKPEDAQSVTAALRSAKKPFVNVEFSDAEHGFFCNSRSSYHPDAAAEAWALTLEFLRRHLGTL